MCINKDVKGAISKLSDDYISRTAPYRPHKARSLENYRSQIFSQKTPTKQLTISAKDDHACEANISKLVQAVTGSSLLPAIVPDNRGMVKVFTNKSADIQQTIDLLNFRKTGSTEMSAFIKSRVTGIPLTNAPLRRKNLKVFKGTKTKQI